MKEGRKISKSKLNHWKLKEKARSEQIVPEISSDKGSYAPRHSHQSVPKSLLRVMQMSQEPNKSNRRRRKPRIGEKILQKQDKKFKTDSIATHCHLRHLRNVAKEEAHQIQRKEEKSKQVLAARAKTAQRGTSERKRKVKDVLKEYRELKMERRKEKRKQARRKLREKRIIFDSDEELEDLTGYQEVQFGEVAQAPPRFTNLKKFLQKIHRTQVNIEAVTGLS